MKKNMFKKMLALLLALAMLFSLAACGLFGGDNGYYSDDDDDDDDRPSKKETVAATESIETEPTEPAAPADELSDPNLRYVMVYNPKIYDENAAYDRSGLSVGTFGSQVDPMGNRGDGLESEDTFTSISQGDFMQNFPQNIEVEGDRADPMGRDYRLNQVRTFVVGGDFSRRTQQSFRSVLELVTLMDSALKSQEGCEAV